MRLPNLQNQQGVKETLVHAARGRMGAAVAAAEVAVVALYGLQSIGTTRLGAGLAGPTALLPVVHSWQGHWLVPCPKRVKAAGRVLLLLQAWVELMVVPGLMEGPEWGGGVVLR
eukprot:1159208-Pelagomonas_calceolata.AAC.16